MVNNRAINSPGFVIIFIFCWERVVVVETQTVTCEINLELYIFMFFTERRVHDRMLVGFVSTYAIDAYSI